MLRIIFVLRLAMVILIVAILLTTLVDRIWKYEYQILCFGLMAFASMILLIMFLMKGVGIFYLEAFILIILFAAFIFYLPVPYITGLSLLFLTSYNLVIANIDNEHLESMILNHSSLFIMATLTAIAGSRGLQELRRKSYWRLVYISDQDALLQKNVTPQSQGRRPKTDDGKHTVFISYSHRDIEWLEKLLPQFESLKWTESKVDYFVDTDIEKGNEWREEINAAADSAELVVLLVSKHYLASDFIQEEELKKFLDKKRDVRVLWVLLSPCLWELHKLKEIQAVHPTAEPLDSLSPAKQEHVFTKLVREVVKYAS